MMALAENPASNHEPQDARTYEPVMIAIVGYKNAEDVRECLKALATSHEKNFIVSICENGGPEAYNAVREALAGIVDFTEVVLTPIGERVSEACNGHLRPHGQRVNLYRASDNLGYAGGINLILRELARAAAWSAIWILNPDTEPHPQALSALIARAAEGDYGIVGSRLLYKKTGRVQSCGGRWRWLIANARSLGRNAPSEALLDIPRLEQKMNYVSGASLFATRDFVKAVGSMDERYFLYCEEVDWCFRRGEKRIGYAHNSVVYHAQGTTIGSSSDRKKRSPLSVYLDERNRHLFTRRFYPRRYPLVAIATLLFTAQYLRKRAGANFIIALAGWYAGLRGEKGLPERFRHDEKA